MRVRKNLVQLDQRREGTMQFAVLEEPSSDTANFMVPSLFWSSCIRFFVTLTPLITMKNTNRSSKTVKYVRLKKNY